MRRPVEREVEVLALLAGARDRASGDGGLEGCGARADFAVDDWVIVRGAGGYGAVQGVAAEVVEDAGDFADLDGEG